MNNLFPTVLKKIRTYWIPLSILLAGIALSFAAFFWLRFNRDLQIKRRLSIQSNSRFKQLQSQLNSYRSVIQSLGKSFGSPQETGRFEFNELTKNLMERHEVISNLQYLEYVKVENQKSFEKKLLYSGFKNPSIQTTKYLDSEGDTPESTSKRSTTNKRTNRGFFPVTYIGPVSPNAKQKLVGLDYLSGTYRFNAAVKAVEQNEVTMVITSPSLRSMKLTDTHTERVTFMFSPVYEGKPVMKEQRWKNLIGLMAFEIPHSNLIENVLFTNQTSNSNIYTFAETGENESALIYTNTDRKSDVDPKDIKTWWSFEKYLSFEDRQWVQNRQWQIIVNPKKAYLSNQRTAYPWVVLVFGLGLTILLARTGYLMSGQYTSLAEKFDSVFNTAPFAIATLEENKEISLWNKSAEEMFESPPEDAIGKKITSFISPPDNEEEEDDSVDVESIIESDDDDDFDDFREMKGLKKDGSTFPISVGFSDWEVQGQKFYTVMAQDITERKEYERQITRLARRDEMTGLFNRRTFMEKIQKEFDQCKRYDYQLSVIMIDLDHFKDINDEHGHLVGDDVLRDIADILKNNTRSSDFAGRYGGEEFCMALPQTNSEDAEHVAERIRTEITERSFPEDLDVTCSLGVAEYSQKIPNKDDLLIRADDALYHSKTHGRNQTTVWKKLNK